MSFDFSSIVFHAQQRLQDDVAIRRGHMFEVIAALLGYNTYAALVLDRAKSSDDWLEQADFVLLQRDLAKARCEQLGFKNPDSDTILDAAIEEFEEAARSLAWGQNRVFKSFDDFRARFLEEDLAERVFDSDEANDAFASTNAYFGDTEVEEIEAAKPLLGCRDEWQVSGSGNIYGDQDEDRMYSGDTICFSITTNFRIVGRVGLVRGDDEIVASRQEEEIDETI